MPQYDPLRDGHPKESAMAQQRRTETTDEPRPTLHELRRAASEWCFVMDRGPDYGWFIQNWRLPGLRPFVEREMKQR